MTLHFMSTSRDFIAWSYISAFTLTACAAANFAAQPTADLDRWLV